MNALKRICRILNELGIRYMLVGSFAASFHGFTRATHDIDLVVAFSESDVESLMAACGVDFSIDPDSAGSAIRNGDMFNIFDLKEMDKVDFWMLKDSEFAQLQFSRRFAVDISGVTAWVESVEDTIISKLIWNKIGKSERQINDVRSILLANPDSLDWAYLDKWASANGVLEILQELKKDN